MSKRFSENDPDTSPADDDIVVGTDVSTGEDKAYTFETIASKVAALLSGQLVTEDDRTKLDTPTPKILVKYCYAEGETAPSIDTENADPGPGWGDVGVIPSTTDTLWRIGATFTDGVFTAPWSDAEPISGQNGLDGLDGNDGAPGNKYFFQAAAPSSIDRLVNDVWWDTDDNFKQYRWDGSDWVESFQPLLTLDEAGRVTGLVRAGESGMAFVLIASQFQVWNGTSATVPFEIVDGVVYIKEAVIRQVSAAKIIGGTITGQEIILAGLGAKIRSDNYVAGTSGWQIDGETAEFPSLIVRNANIEANAASRRYGSNLSNTGLLAADAWQEVGYIDVTMAAGDTAVVQVSFQHEVALSAPFPTDGFIRLRRADGSEVKQASYTLPEGNTIPVHYHWYDITVTTRYYFDIKSAGGTGGARGTTLTAVIHRK